jgi:hypothetical protein
MGTERFDVTGLPSRSKIPGVRDECAQTLKTLGQAV